MNDQIELTVVQKGFDKTNQIDVAVLCSRSKLWGWLNTRQITYAEWRNIGETMGWKYDGK